jgi:hypothetical protein
MTLSRRTEIGDDHSWQNNRLRCRKIAKLQSKQKCKGKLLTRCHLHFKNTYYCCHLILVNLKRNWYSQAAGARINYSQYSETKAKKVIILFSVGIPLLGVSGKEIAQKKIYINMTLLTWFTTIATKMESTSICNTKISLQESSHLNLI